MDWWSRLRGGSDPGPFGALGFSPEEVEAITTATGPEEIAAVGLDWLARRVPCEACYSYVWSPIDHLFRLSGTLTPSEHHDPEPSYSGLMAGSGSTASVPLTLSIADVPPQPEAAKLAEHLWLTVPCGSYILLRARFDRRFRLKDKQLAELRDFSQLVTPMLGMAQRVAEANAEGLRLQLSLKAAHVATQALLSPDRSLEVLFKLPSGMLLSDHGCLIVIDRETGASTIKADFGQGRAIGTRLLDGELPELTNLAASSDQITGSGLGGLITSGVAAVVRLPVLQEGELRACAYYFQPEAEPLDDYKVSVLTTLADRIAQVFTNSLLMEETTAEYLVTLQSLVQAMDSQYPYSQGHSERMARYARITARELGLPPGPVEAIALGAYLHDVGMSTIDPGVVNASGRLSSDQYDQVKQHPSLGAELVGALQAAMPIAPMIQHHHERWDGRGYPHQLVGREIPLGARIIAVCDLFEAKTTSRPHRKAQPFADALQDLRAAAGNQLDSDAVEAFIRGFGQLGAAANPGEPLAACWVVKQLTPSICGNCPNRRPDAPIACWQNPEHLCTNHGDDCAECLVFTEALKRAKGGIYLAR